MAPVLGVIASAIPGLVSETLKRVLPAEKISEADRARLEHELTLAVMTQGLENFKVETQDRGSARLLAEKDVAKGNAFTTSLSALVRPVWGFGALVLVAYSVLVGYQIEGAVQSIIEAVIYFYFGGRVIEKVIPHITSAAAIRKSGN